MKSKRVGTIDICKTCDAVFIVEWPHQTHCLNCLVLTSSRTTNEIWRKAIILEKKLKASLDAQVTVWTNRDYDQAYLRSLIPK